MFFIQASFRGFCLFALLSLSEIIVALYGTTKQKKVKFCYQTVSFFVCSFSSCFRPLQARAWQIVGLSNSPCQNNRLFSPKPQILETCLHGMPPNKTEQTERTAKIREWLLNSLISLHLVRVLERVSDRGLGLSTGLTAAQNPALSQTGKKIK